MGSAYFIIPEECESEIAWPRLAYVQLVALVVVGVTAVIGFHFNWWEGRKFLEIPRPLDFLVVVDVLLFIGNIGMTIWKANRRTTTSMVLFFGLFMAALLYLPGMIPTVNQTVDSYWRWWVVHLWVEGVWELIMGGIRDVEAVVGDGAEVAQLLQVHGTGVSTARVVPSLIADALE